MVKTRDHAYECWANRAGGVCRNGCSCWCHDYAPRDPEQEARFVAFVKRCEGLIQSAEGHSHVVDFVRTLDLDAMRALYSLAVKANATGLIVILGGVGEEKGWHI